MQGEAEIILRAIPKMKPLPTLLTRFLALFPKAPLYSFGALGKDRTALAF
jgi:hypothetical protein